MKKLKIVYLLAFFCLIPLSVFAQYFNVKDYGAQGNKKLCTIAIQKAIDAAAKAGGGRVIVPAGEYLSGPLFCEVILFLRFVPVPQFIFMMILLILRLLWGRGKGLNGKYMPLFLLDTIWKM